MLDRQHGRVVYECDGCGEVLETGEPDFEVARIVLREQGWAARREHSAWQHLCPECRE